MPWMGEGCIYTSLNLSNDLISKIEGLLKNRLFLSLNEAIRCGLVSSFFHLKCAFFSVKVNFGYGPKIMIPFYCSKKLRGIIDDWTYAIGTVNRSQFVEQCLTYYVNNLLEIGFGPHPSLLNGLTREEINTYIKKLRINRPRLSQ